MHMRAWRRASMVLLAAIGLASSGACAGVTLPWQTASTALVASGTLEADETVIATRVSGAIKELPVREGDAVQPGMLLVRIDDRAARLAVRQALDPAARQTFELQAEDFELRSPLAGVVTRVPAHVGEIAFPGQVLLAVADLSRLDLTLYVRLADLDQVRVGQAIEVTPDTDPGRVFHGVVTAVNQEAEFTPRNVQTRADRLNLVFGVRAQVDNVDGWLKPGMPVDATFAAAAR
ncbi:MAG: efflux RND transporter periplasmic adaptor subunit [Dehalococcoidia bacterium]